MPKTPKEKRLKRFRSNPTIKIRERIDRAVRQRLFLVDISAPATCPNHGGPSLKFTVLGSTGNVYEAIISKVPTCNCPDARKGNLCKHLLFVMMKVVGLDVSSQLVFQSAYLTEELETILTILRQRTARLGRDVVANDTVRQRHGAIKKEEEATEEEEDGENSKAKSRREVEGDCPICFDPLGSSLAQLTYCSRTCGVNFHKACIQMWTRQSSQRGNPTCPACRQPWADVQTGGKRQQQQSRSPGANEGYENLGNLQGQSPVRDTSTYHSPYSGYKRRRW